MKYKNCSYIGITQLHLINSLSSSLILDQNSRRRDLHIIDNFIALFSHACMLACSKLIYGMIAPETNTKHSVNLLICSITHI